MNDMIESIADHLVQDHVDLLKENEQLRAQLEDAKKHLAAVVEINVKQTIETERKFRRARLDELANNIIDAVDEVKYICKGCFYPCEIGEFDNSYDDEFGRACQVDTLSTCCEDEFWGRHD